MAKSPVDMRDSNNVIYQKAKLIMSYICPTLKKRVYVSPECGEVKLVFLEEKPNTSRYCAHQTFKLQCVCGETHNIVVKKV